MLKFLNKIDRFTHRTLEAMCSLLLAAMVGFTLYNVTMRYVFNNPPVWGDLLTVLSNIWLMFIALSLWEMWYFEISMQGIEFKENYMPKKYAVAILPLAGFLTTIGAAIGFVKKV